MNTSAPVIERASAARKVPGKIRGKEADWRPQIYTVLQGDTLYGIALEYGFDYKEVAEWNGIEPPYTIRIGQQLKLTASRPAVVTTPLKTVSTVEARQAGEDGLLKTQPKALRQPYSSQGDSDPLQAKAHTESYAERADKPAPVVAKTETQTKLAPAEEKAAPDEKKDGIPAEDDERIEWIWPTAGKVVTGFNEASSAGKGLDISGKNGQPVLAAAPGKVVYSGSGLRGYGKLVIIKHNKTYLSAYAHNRQILIKEGQSVVKGQKIAEMGDSDADQVMLHFEIRRLGKPVDPMKYLPQTTFHGLKPVESRSPLGNDGPS
ncbi:MAG TPA: peptidoglycan DD-metalloendopeptidase family protein [Sulfuricella sp.]|nr:peptidoglycan DD-metalloendopeptidase family protein [Sulfuricella sp.]